MRTMTATTATFQGRTYTPFPTPLRIKVNGSIPQGSVHKPLDERIALGITQDSVYVAAPVGEKEPRWLIASRCADQV